MHEFSFSCSMIQRDAAADAMCTHGSASLHLHFKAPYACFRAHILLATSAYREMRRCHGTLDTASGPRRFQSLTAISCYFSFHEDCASLLGSLQPDARWLSPRASMRKMAPSFMSRSSLHLEWLWMPFLSSRLFQMGFDLFSLAVYLHHMRVSCHASVFPKPSPFSLLHMYMILMPRYTQVVIWLYSVWFSYFYSDYFRKQSIYIFIISIPYLNYRVFEHSSFLHSPRFTIRLLMLCFPTFFTSGVNWQLHTHCESHIYSICWYLRTRHL